MRNTGDLRMRVALQRRTVTTLGGKTREDWETIGLYAAEVLHAAHLLPRAGLAGTVAGAGL